MGIRAGIPLLALCLLARGAAAQNILSVDPDQGEPGQSLTITITGEIDYPFVLPAEITFSPATAITHDEPYLLDIDKLVTTITIPADTPCGPQDIVVQTSNYTYVGAGAFNVCQPGEPLIVSVVPDRGSAGEQLQVRVTGIYTHFLAGTSQLSLGAGITVDSVTVNDETTLDADITISGAAVAGPRDVTVTTSGETASGGGLFEVMAPQVTLSPASAVQGETVPTITVSGSGFDSSTTADLGEGIAIGGRQSPDPQTLQLLQVAVALNAPVGSHDLVLNDPDLTVAGAFTVVQGPETKLLSISPASADRGHPGIEVSLVGQNTHFDDGDVSVLLAVAHTSCNWHHGDDATHLRARLVIGDDAPEGPGDVTVALGLGSDCGNCEAVTLAGGFTITAPGSILAVEPTDLPAGETVTIDVTGSEGHFSAGSSQVFIEPPEGIEVGTVVVSDADHLQAELTITADASGRPRDISVVSGPEVASGTGLVDVSNPAIERVFPGSGLPGSELELTIQAVDFTFAAGSQVVFSGSGISVLAVTVDGLDASRLLVDIAIAADAPLGPRDLTVSSGTREFFLPAAFSVTSLPTGSAGSGCSCSSQPTGTAGWWLLALLLAALSGRRRGRFFYFSGLIDRKFDPK